MGTYLSSGTTQTSSILSITFGPTVSTSWHPLPFPYLLLIFSLSFDSLGTILWLKITLCTQGWGSFALKNRLLYYINGVKCGSVFSDKLEIYFSYFEVRNKIGNFEVQKEIIYGHISTNVNLSSSKLRVYYNFKTLFPIAGSPKT